MKLRTSIQITKPDFELSYQDQLLLVGSCFTENIGGKLQENKVPSLYNPLGIAFNPISLHHLLQLKPTDVPKIVEGLNQQEELYFHYQFHSIFNSVKKKEFETKLSQAIEHQQELLSKKVIVFISYGTAWVYQLISKGKIVNNCHQQPQKLFDKKLLSKEEIVADWQTLFDGLKREYNKDFTFIFTLSPVRHLKDGFIENQQSKAVLLTAIHEIIGIYMNCHYFPAYEIMMDDLRDYRFYQKDLVHPNEQAVDYIWEKFITTYFSNDTLQQIEEVGKIMQAVQHRAFYPHSTKHQDFLEKLLKKINAFSQFNKIDFSKEVQIIEKQLIK